ncbi:MAG: macro domain-containing protein [Deltaproteobacteria bacterium]|nr:macro domain-containing protein [Deltaproteobacteria bacterium]
MDERLIASLTFEGGGEFKVVVHDLLREPVDCIVNAANGMLAHGGGVAAAIARAAGNSLVVDGDRLVREQGPVPTGGAVMTTAGKLPFKGVIHAIGPRMGQGKEEEKLVQALESAFLLAHERGWSSLSFPGISSGIFAVPHDVCARAYLKAVRAFFSGHADSTLKVIRLCLFEGPLLDTVKREIERRDA